MVWGYRGMFRHKIGPNKALAPGGFYYRTPCYQRCGSGRCFWTVSFDSEGACAQW